MASRSARPLPDGERLAGAEERDGPLQASSPLRNSAIVTPAPPSSGSAG